MTDHPRPYNPLDKKNLGVSVGDALLASEAHPLPPPNKFLGAGIYCIYYRGDFPLYKKISDANLDDWRVPIYIGKAIPGGSRKGKDSNKGASKKGKKGAPLPDDAPLADTLESMEILLDSKPTPDLYSRLSQHSKSIEYAKNLSLEHFRCRWLVVEDIWIPLGEATLVQRFRPLWNLIVDGFGNKDPGKKRYEGDRSRWDTLHPGRPYGDRCQPRTDDQEALVQRVLAFDPPLE